jgi:hypothetical protein
MDTVFFRGEAVASRAGRGKLWISLMSQAMDMERCFASMWLAMEIPQR